MTVKQFWTPQQGFDIMQRMHMTPEEVMNAVFTNTPFLVTCDAVTKFIEEC